MLETKISSSLVCTLQVLIQEIFLSKKSLSFNACSERPPRGAHLFVLVSHLVNNMLAFCVVLGFHLSFSLINDQPETGILTWNIREAVSGKTWQLVGLLSTHFYACIFQNGVNLKKQQLYMSSSCDC